jgi:predicted small metal-binding protein
MADLALRCPRSKHTMTSDNAEALADDMLAHVKAEHGHEPPREHVLARIERQNG